jgi:hypothetical protein
VVRQRPTDLKTIAGAWLCSLAIMAVGRGASQTAPPEGWPRQVGERKPYACEYGFVYIQEKSALDTIQKALATAAEDAQRDGLATCPAGLVLVVDAGEKYPCEIAKLTEVLKKMDPNEPPIGQKAVLEAEDQSKELELDAGTFLSLGPVSIPPSSLHEVIADFPADVDRQIGWCVIVPTDACIKTNSKLMTDAGIRERKPGLAERMAIAASRPLIDRQMASMMVKTRQAGLYEILLRTQKDLSPQQRQAKIDAYKEKLGLKKKSNPLKEGKDK